MELKGALGHDKMLWNRRSTEPYSVIISRDADKKLTFESSRNGVLLDISDDVRSYAIPVREMIANSEPCFKCLHIVKHPDIIALSRLERPDIDALYIRRPYGRIVIVADSCNAEWKSPEFE